MDKYEEYEWSVLDESSHGWWSRNWGRGHRIKTSKKLIRRSDMSICAQENHMGLGNVLIFAWIPLFALFIIATGHFGASYTVPQFFVVLASFCALPVTGVRLLWVYQDDVAVVRARKRLIGEGVVPPLKEQESGV